MKATATQSTSTTKSKQRLLNCAIYSYWEGPRHWYYDLCHETVLRHNPQARVLTRSDVEKVLGPLPSVLDSMYVTHRVDWIRKAFIHRVGGLWIDMDFVCFSDLSPIASLGKMFDFVGFKEWGNDAFMDNFFVGKKGSVILADAAEYALSQAEKNGRNTPWLSMATDAMRFAMEKNPWTHWMQIPTHLVSPVGFAKHHSDWYSGQDAHHAQEEIDKFKCFGFMTSKHMLDNWLDQLGSAEALLMGTSRLGTLVRKGLGLK